MRKFDAIFMDDVICDIKSNAIPMLMGEPGIGKSSWVEALAKKMGAHFFCLACNQFADKADVTGARLVPVEKANGKQTYQQQFYPYKVIDEAIDCALANPDDLVILFMDEINRTTPDVTSELLSIPTARKLGDTELPNNVRIITAGNDHGNVTALDEASLSRFAMYRVGPDVDTFIAVNPGLYGPIEKVLRAHPETLFCKKIVEAVKTDDDDDVYANVDSLLDGDDGQEQITTPRTIAKLSDWFNTFLTDHTPADLIERMNCVYTNEHTGETTNALIEKIESNVGHTMFAQYLSLEIVDALTVSTPKSANTVMPVKPANFESFMAITTVDGLDEAVEKMSEKEQSHMLAWALADNRDCTAQVSALARQLNRFDADDNKIIYRAYGENTLNPVNVNAFLNAGGPMSGPYSMLWNAQ